LFRAPNLGVIRAQRFHRRKAHDEVSDGPRPYQQSANRCGLPMNLQL
jgi:hypothetical protein